MILYSLSRLYDRLRSDPRSGIAPFGFSDQKIAFCVVLERDGSLSDVGIEDLRRAHGKNLVPAGMLVPGGAKPSGAGINPNFLWDNPAYMLGFELDDAKPEKTAEKFSAFRDRHVALDSEIGDPEFSAVCRFLRHWKPAAAMDLPLLSELTGGFGVFRVRGEQRYVHQRPKVDDYWRRQVRAGDAAERGQCLVTGESGTIARLHQPLIKGVLGAQPGGAAIVSFNCDAFESYGKSQSLNAPVGEDAAFQYATALNYLLRSGSRQRVQIGDATVVFWTDTPTKAEEFFGYMFDPSGAQDDALKLELGAFLARIAVGEYPAELGSPETPFFVLGLSANAARISVRFWFQSTLREVSDRVGLHYRDLEIVRSARDTPFPPPWQLLRETARESKDIPPFLSGALMRAILNGLPYPEAMFAAVIRRIRADRRVGHVRSAILKACLTRRSRTQTGSMSQEVPVSLDPNRPEPAYQMGRLFAELEKTQEDALPGLNDTIKDRFFGSASATPATVFPRLLRLSQHHLGKLEHGPRVYHDRRIQEICQRLDGFARHLGLEDQGLFAIGYYHQRHDIFTKKSPPEGDAGRE